jgi:hypothetical protein
VLRIGDTGGPRDRRLPRRWLQSRGEAQVFGEDNQDPVRTCHAVRIPNCSVTLIFEDRQQLTVIAQIAHIRSGSPDGPRYVPDYPSELINSEENLLLLCGTHHKPVDDHESVYRIDELLDWKRRQAAEGTGRKLSEHELAQIIQHLDQLLAALTEVKVTVRPVSVIHTGCRGISIPLMGLETTTISVPEQARYLGVEVVNEGLVPVTIDAVGIDLDVEAPSYPGYQFPLDAPLLCPPRRIEGKSSATWLAHPPTVGAGVMQIAKECLRMPSHFRPYVLPSAGDRVEGQWLSATRLPIWKPGMTEERLQDLLEKSAKARRRVAPR